MNARSPIALLLAVTLAGCSSDPGAADGAGHSAFPDEPLLTIASETGALHLEVRSSPQPPVRGRLSVEYVITDAAGDARDDLEIAVVPWMPDMGHGASTKPTVRAEGDGHYVVEGLSLFMPGEWDLRTTLGGGVKDSATIALQIP